MRHVSACLVDSLQQWKLVPIAAAAVERNALLAGSAVERKAYLAGSAVVSRGVARGRSGGVSCGVARGRSGGW